VVSAWGQAEFQGGRDVRSLFLSYTGPKLLHGPSPASTLRSRLHIPGRRQRIGHPCWIRTEWRRLPLPPDSASHSLSCLFLCLASKFLYL
jgi:hypothetical protein